MKKKTEDAVLGEVRKTIARYRMFDRGDLVIAAVSGGPDSMCLLHALSCLRSEYSLSIRVAHLNHHMREEAESNASMVADFAKSFGIETTVGHADVLALAKESGMGVEEAGREARLRFLGELSASFGASKIAMGHNMNDQAETVLMRLVRGAGARGLGGIPPVNGNIVRPLINIPRQWIDDYCKKNQIPVMTDSYNLDLNYTRNRMRYRTIPRLAEAYNPSVIWTLATVADSLRADAGYLDLVADEAFRSLTHRDRRFCSVDLRGLISLHPSIASRVIEMAWRDAGGDSDLNLGFSRVRQIMESSSLESYRQSLPGGVSAVLQEGSIVFHPVPPKELWIPLEVPGEVQVPELGVVVSTEILSGPEVVGRVLARKGSMSQCANSFGFLEGEAYFDYNLCEGTLAVRTRRDGDRFQPLGMSGRWKKLQDYFTQIKMPRHERDFIPIVVSGDKILWVGGYRVDERFRVSANTDKVLRIALWPRLRHLGNCATI